MDVTIYHNSACGTSRNTLALIRASGVEPTIVDYLRTPPSRNEIRSLADRAGIAIRDLLREKGTPFAELGLDDRALSDEHLLDAIERHPILLNRPIVASDRGVRLCRPSELVLDLIPPLPADFTKEGGEVVKTGL